MKRCREVDGNRFPLAFRSASLPSTMRRRLRLGWLCRFEEQLMLIPTKVPADQAARVLHGATLFDIDAKLGFTDRDCDDE